MPCCFLVDDGRRKNEGPAADLVFRLVTSRPNALSESERAHPSETEWSEIEATETFCTDSPDEIDRIATAVAAKITAFAQVAREE
jgi:hypothetical protein